MIFDEKVGKFYPSGILEDMESDDFSYDFWEPYPVDEKFQLHLLMIIEKGKKLLMN